MGTDVMTTGRMLVAAGVMMAAGVVGEWVLGPQQPDGSVTRPAVFAALVLATTAGWGLLGVAANGLRARAVAVTRGVRVGARLLGVGAALLVAGGLTVAVTGLVTGAPAEAAFLAFALGMLLAAVGALTLGLAYRRQSPGSGTWPALVLAGVTTLVAIAVPVDAVHEASMVASFAAWTALGVRLWTGPIRAQAPTVAVAASGSPRA